MSRVLKEVSTSSASAAGILQEATNDSKEVSVTGLIFSLWSSDSLVKMYKESMVVRDPMEARALLMTKPWFLLILSTAHAWVTVEIISAQTERAQYQR